MFMSEADNNLLVDDKIGLRRTIIDKILVRSRRNGGGEWRCK